MFAESTFYIKLLYVVFYSFLYSLWLLMQKKFVFGIKIDKENLAVRITLKKIEG